MIYYFRKHIHVLKLNNTRFLLKIMILMLSSEFDYQ